MLITIEDAMQRYNLSRRTLGRRMQQHHITRHQRGKTVLLETSELDTIFDLPVQPSDPAESNGAVCGHGIAAESPPVATRVCDEIPAVRLILPHPDDLDAACERALHERKLWPRLFAR